MNPRTMVKLKSGISGDTVEAIRAYLAGFAHGSYEFEQTGARTTVHLTDIRDHRLLWEQFADLVEGEVEPS